MKKLLSIAFLTISTIAFSQTATVYFPDKVAFSQPDGQRKTVRPFYYYLGDSALFSGSYTTNNDYYRNPTVFMWGDTLYVTFSVTKGHDYTQGFQRIVKYSKGVTGRFKYTSQASDKAILYQNNSITYNLLNDTIYGIRYTVAYPSDTILMLDKNFNRIGTGAIYFDKTASGVASSFLCVSKIIEDDSGYFYMAGYERPSNDYIGKILRSKNRGRSWSVVKTIPFQSRVIRPEELSVARGAGDTLLCFMRSDYGNLTWMCKSPDGINWTDPVKAFKGANQPKAITIADSIIICTSRLVGWPSEDNEIKKLNDTLLHGETFDYMVYTTFNVSWDYGNTWHEFFLDRIRTEQFSLDSDFTRLTSEVADIVQLTGDTMRVYWASGAYIDISKDYGDLNYTDFVINRYQPGDLRFFGGGGVSAPKTNYYTNINVKNLTIKDTANKTFASINVQKNKTVFANTDTVHIKQSVKIDSSLFVPAKSISNLPYLLTIDTLTNEVKKQLIPTSTSVVTGLSTGQILFGGGNNQIRQSNNLFYDSSNNRLGIGTSSPSHFTTISSGTLGNGVSALSVSGTMPTTHTGGQYGILGTFTGAGSSNFFNAALRIVYNSGYTGSAASSALSFYQNNASTGNDLRWNANNTTPLGNQGFVGFSFGTTSGANLGGYAEAGNGNLNVGFMGSAKATKNNSANIGVIGQGINTGTSSISIGGLFSLAATAPSYQSGALIADNGTTINPIFLAQDNGATVVTIADGGNMTVGSGNNIVGASNGSDAATGNLGEYKSRVVTSSSSVSLTSTVTANVDSITLTAGDWDLTGIVKFELSGATTTDMRSGFDFASATMGNDSMFIQKPFNFNSITNTYSDALPTVRISISSTTKVYFVAQSTFSAGAVSVYGNIRARRVR